MKVSGCLFRRMLALVTLSGTSCSAPDSAGPTAANTGKYYSVATKAAEFYHYGPQQANGPDQKLPPDTLVLLIRRSFGYSKVQLMNGEEGYVASQDLHSASPAMVAAATNPPPNTSSERNRTSRSRYNLTDPRFFPPPEPLPEDLPEPTPIPGAEPSASP
jgi:hypothetical protein